MTVRIQICNCLLKEYDIHQIDLHKYTATIHYLNPDTQEYNVLSFQRVKVKK